MYMHTGTLLYMSKEQIYPNEATPINASSDVFALGVIFYEIVVGYHPFFPTKISICASKESLPTEEVDEFQVNVKKMNVHEVSSEFPQEWGKLLLKTLDADQSRRFRYVYLCVYVCMHVWRGVCC